MSTILITGGAGFIGSHVVDACRAAGHRIAVVDDLSRGSRANLPPDVELFPVDIADRDSLAHVVAAVRPDIINHHAAQIDVRRSVEDPRGDAAINILGSLNLLDLAVAHGVRTVVFAASGGTLYGEVTTSAPPDEDAPHRPESPYGCAKIAVEHYLRFYRRVHGLRTAVLRYANVYGPRQDPHGEAGVVSIFATRMLADQPVVIYGDGEQTRDFVYVGDVADANVRAMRPDAPDEFAVNIGTGVETSVNRLYAVMAELVGYRRQPVYRAARAGEIRRSVLDASRAAGVLGWRPRTTLEEGLRRTVDFFRSVAATSRT
jgi:UDP-glucose 4-epimerase